MLPGIAAYAIVLGESSDMHKFLFTTVQIPVPLSLVQSSECGHVFHKSRLDINSKCISMISKLMCLGVFEQQCMHIFVTRLVCVCVVCPCIVGWLDILSLVLSEDLFTSMFAFEPVSACCDFAVSCYYCCQVSLFYGDLCGISVPVHLLTVP